MNKRMEAIRTAQNWLRVEPLFLDTETTGLAENDEIVEIAIIDVEGNVVLDQLVQPTIPIPAEAYNVHGLNNKEVADAPAFAEVLSYLEELLRERIVVIYNLDYDTRLLRQSAAAHGLELPAWWAPVRSTGPRQWLAERGLGDRRWHCAMALYAQFYGEWNNHRGAYRWQSLSNAAWQCRIELPDNVHRARADAELTRQVVQHMAAQEQ